ncbi:MAG TPA: hypothetical protein VFF73_33955 [Planctomycetota bacterium]|nr:hypothetical protein [Planctomycetota bacterium]
MRRFALLLVCCVAVTVSGEEREERLDASHVKVGQVYRWKLVAQNASEWAVTARTDDEVRYRIRLTVAGKESPGKDDVHSFALKRKTEGKAATGEKETLKVSGVEFPCTILVTESGGTTVKTWRSEKFPEILKTQLGKDVTSELVEITNPK